MASEATLIQYARVIDGTGSPPSERASVLVQEHRVVHVDASRGIPVDGTARVIDRSST